MADESADRIQRLELEIKELREQLASGGLKRKVADVSADELQAYLKVRDMVAADYGDFCGINDCFRCIAICRSCQICQTCRVCDFCIIECSCGPCNSGGGVRGSLNRFRDLGG